MRAVAAFAQRSGFDVDASDAESMRQVMLDAADRDRDLSDDELAGIEGGDLGTVAMLAGAAAIFIGGVVIAGPAVGSAIAVTNIQAVRDWLSQW